MTVGRRASNDESGLMDYGQRTKDWILWLKRGMTTMQGRTARRPCMCELISRSRNPGWC